MDKGATLNEAISLLKVLISTPSVSREEEAAANALQTKLCTRLRYDAGNGRSHKILYFPGAENGTGGQQDLYEYRVSGWDLCLDLCPYGTWIFRKYHVSSWR